MARCGWSFLSLIPESPSCSVGSLCRLFLCILFPCLLSPALYILRSGDVGFHFCLLHVIVFGKIVHLMDFIFSSTIRKGAWRGRMIALFPIRLGGLGGSFRAFSLAITSVSGEATEILEATFRRPISSFGANLNQFKSCGQIHSLVQNPV